MTPEKFRQWIVILLAAFLVTLWVGLGMKLCRMSKYCAIAREGAMRRQWPGRVKMREKIPFRSRLPKREIKPVEKQTK